MFLVGDDIAITPQVSGVYGFSLTALHVVELFARNMRGTFIGRKLRDWPRVGERLMAIHCTFHKSLLHKSRDRHIAGGGSRCTRSLHFAADKPGAGSRDFRADPNFLPFVTVPC